MQTDRQKIVVGEWYVCLDHKLEALRATTSGGGSGTSCPITPQCPKLFAPRQMLGLLGCSQFRPHQVFVNLPKLAIEVEQGLRNLMHHKHIQPLMGLCHQSGIKAQGVIESEAR